jgi:hypothetical protein
MRSFFVKQRLANSTQIWQTATKFSKVLIDFSLKSVDLIVGNIEWPFFAKQCSPKSFCLAKKVG